jgi:hypothetical protein
MIIQEDKEKVKIELTRKEIDTIIEELNRVPYNVFKFGGYDKLIRRIRKEIK